MAELYDYQWQNGLEPPCYHWEGSRDGFIAQVTVELPDGSKYTYRSKRPESSKTKARRAAAKTALEQLPLDNLDRFLTGDQDAWRLPYTSIGATRDGYSSGTQKVTTYVEGKYHCKAEITHVNSSMLVGAGVVVFCN